MSLNETVTELFHIYWPLTQNKIRRGLKNHTFGYVRNGGAKGHWGWDFFAKEGTPCFSIAQGKIVEIYGTQADKSNFGLTVVLEFKLHGCITYAAYCHLMGASVKKGDPGDAGQMIGFTGNSGNAHTMKGDDEHLHFEIRTSARPLPGGVPKRIDPIGVFETCPLDQTIFESYEWAMK